MDSYVFAASPSGRPVRTRTGYDAFVPAHLAPQLGWSETMAASIERAALALGALDSSIQLDGASYVSLLASRDAVSAVRSEGKAVTVHSYFAARAAASQEMAARLCDKYVVTLARARARLEEMPLSLRLLRELHLSLLDGVVDPRTTPGEFRRTQNWLGSAGCTLSNATFVPPPPGEMTELLHDWESFLHRVSTLPTLVRLGLAHYQYLVIHPFLDMNILTGAVLAAVMLQHFGIARSPLPIYGRWLERNSRNLLQRVLSVCSAACWEEWLSWYLHGVADAAHDTLECLERLRQLRSQHMTRLEAVQASAVMRRSYDALLRQPAITADWLMAHENLSPIETRDALGLLESEGIVVREDSHENGIYYASGILSALEDGGAYSFPF